MKKPKHRNYKALRARDAMVTGLFIGRFQPLHKGHLQVIADALDEVHMLNIVLGNSEGPPTYDHCLTAEERQELIIECCRDEKLDLKHIKFFQQEDVPDDEEWVQLILEKVGAVDVVYSGNPLVMRLFAQAGYKVVDCEEEIVHNVHGTPIRRKIVFDDESWKEDVPAAVIVFLERKNIIERIKGFHTKEN